MLLMITKECRYADVLTVVVLRIRNQCASISGFASVLSTVKVILYTAMDEKKRKYQEDDNEGASYAITAVVTDEDGPNTNLLPDLSSSRAQNNNNIQGQIINPDGVQNRSLTNRPPPELEEPARTTVQGNVECIRSSHSQIVNIDNLDTVAITPDNNIYPSTEHNENVVTDPHKLEQSGVSSDQNNGEGIRSSQSQIFNIDGPYDISLSIDDDSTFPDTEQNADVLGRVLILDSDNNMKMVKNLSFAKNAEGNRSRQSQIIKKENVVGQVLVVNPVNNMKVARDLILTDIREPKLEEPETSANQGNAEGIRSSQSQAVNTANTDTRRTMSNNRARPRPLCKQKITSKTRRLTSTNNVKIVQHRRATNMLPIKEEVSSSEDEVIEISSDSSQSSTESIPKVMVSMNTSTESITIDLKNQVRQKNLVEVSASFSNSVIKISSIGTNKNSEVSVSFGKMFGIKKEEVTDSEDEPTIFDSSATAPSESQSDTISHDSSSNVDIQIPSQSSSYDTNYESSNTDASINRDMNLDFGDTSADLSPDDSNSEEIEEKDIFRPYRI